MKHPPLTRPTIYQVVVVVVLPSSSSRLGPLLRDAAISPPSSSPPVYRPRRHEMAEIEIKTAPADFRFPTTNQTRHCFTRYIEYHRCVNAKGEATADCEKFAKYYRSLCPAEWVEKWNEQRENGTFAGPLQISCLRVFSDQSTALIGVTAIIWFEFMLLLLFFKLIDNVVGGMDDAGEISSFSRSSSAREDDEEDLRWAALEKLPTYDRARTALLAMPDGELREVNVQRLAAVERRAQRAAGVADDHARFLAKFKERVDR
uniref:Uncharacterized protein n=1 Tax=Oryza meridionalis TaxID=40149 RepID=A0A0E0CGV6_9ORYZ